jgi:hypothetical protein
MNGVKYPFGKADVRTVTTATTINVEVSDQSTTLKLSANLTAATTINVTPVGVENGAHLHIQIPCGGTAFNATFGSTFVTSPGVTGVINKTKLASFLYMDGKFVQFAEATIN